jgi:hypothetical protein
MLINDKFQLIKKKYPFPYVKIDNFFDNKIIDDLEQLYPSYVEFEKNKNTVGRMDGDATSGNSLYENFLKKSASFKTFHEWVYSKEFFNFFIDIFKEDLVKEFENGSLKINFSDDVTYNEKPYELSEVFGINNFKKKKKEFFFYPRLDIGYGRKNYGVFNGGSGPHIDNPQRLISILIFLGGYKSIEGGEHRVYEKKEKDLKIFESYKPVKNRVIASIQNNNAFHDVNPIKEIVGQRNAFYLAISGTKKIWEDCEKNSLNKRYNSNRYYYSNFDLIFKRVKNKITKKLAKIL